MRCIPAFAAGAGGLGSLWLTGGGAMRVVLDGARVFDGRSLRDGLAVVIEGGRVAAVLPRDQAPGPRSDLGGGVLAPGWVDLQVNGGGGAMLDGTADAATIARICTAHRALGCAGILPTLITDTPEATARVLAAGAEAARAGVPGFLGLHLEGPHLDPARAGAHDPALIRPMTDADLARLIAARAALPALMVTLAPAAATPAQIAALARAGVVVSLGHADCTAAEARAALDAGATCVTHLFNAMSPLGHRAPGLPGAVLAGRVAAGLIADGIHVAPEVLRIALAARRDGLFLVSDAMAVAGTSQDSFTLGNRTIRRAGGRLTLADGTLAGADLTLAQAVAVLVGQAGAPLARALAMATRIPAGVIGAGRRFGRIAPGRQADLVWLRDDLSLGRVWHAGQHAQS